MKFNKRTGAVFGLGALAASCLLANPGSALARATANVSIGDDYFSPTTVTINVNDQVVWTWIGVIPHSSTESDVVPLWDSGIHSGSFAFTHTFPASGSFPYHCSVHAFMLGTVTVQAAANLPPAVSITSPASGTILAEPATFTVAATASDSDGSITNLQFFQGSSSLGNRATSPYSVQVSSLSAGNYNLSAVASDNGGLTATNTVSIQVVAPIQTLLSAPSRTTATSFRFSYSANVGLNYVVQRSANLSSWTPLVTNRAGSNPVVYIDNAAAGSPAFYRVGRLPNP